MHKLLSVAVALLLIPVAGHTQDSPARKNELLVALDAGQSVFRAENGRMTSLDARLTQLLASYGLDRIEVIGHAPPPTAAAAPLYLKLTTTRPGVDLDAAIGELRNTGHFQAVTRNYLMKLAALPNDLLLSQQWYVHTASDADIDLPEAWAVTTGNSSVTIGIVDTGVDVTHPDLSATIWTNTGETPGNGIDDDNNGYIDDVHGWDFGNNDAAPSPEPLFDENGMDVAYHGTFVAGIASATTNNATGLAGAGWQCRIVPCKVVDTIGEIPLDAVTEAFQYAVDKHIDVLNVSFGARGDGLAEFFQSVVDLATTGNVICVAAAGNDNSNTPLYPAACSKVIAVAATNESNARADFSNYGNWVDVAAPGTGMISTICQNYELDFASQLFYLLFFGWDGETPYMFGDGTSFASPLVAGVCGLVRSVYPSATPHQVALQLSFTGDDVPYDQPIGRKVNAFKAVSEALPLVVGTGETQAAPFTALRGVPNPFFAQTLISFGLTRAGFVQAEVFDVQGRKVAELLRGELATGRHSLSWAGQRDDGSPVSAGAYFVRLTGPEGTSTQKLWLLR